MTLAPELTSRAASAPNRGLTAPSTRWAAACNPASLTNLSRPLAAGAAAPNVVMRDGASDVRLYGEADLLPQDEPLLPAGHGGSRLLRDLVAAGGPEQREAIVRERLFEIGFDWMGYYSTAKRPNGELDRSFLSTYAPPEWSRMYFDEAYDTIDPRVAESARSALPLAWDLASLDHMLDSRPASARSRRFARDVHDSGMGSGVFLRIHSGDALAVMSLVSCAPSRRWIDDQVLGEALHFSLNMHHYLTQHMRIPGPPAEARASSALDGLSAPQQSVLRHLVSGLTDREIAERLQMSPHTVDYHLRQLRQRFAVRNRVQLCSAAAQLMTGS